MKPIIGITAFEEQVQGFHTLNTNYINAVFAAGGIPVILPTTNDQEAFDGYMDLIHGLIFLGNRYFTLYYGEIL